jgi:membrane protein DedA with SNARE-associated domain
MDRLLDFLLGLSGPGPYFMVFLILLACGLGLPIPEDITLFAAGLLSYYGNANVWAMIGVCFFGVLVGDTIIFTLGAVYGRKLTKKWFFRKILPQERLDLVASKLKHQGNKVIFAARFMPGLRAPVYFTCGTLHVPFRVFFFFDGLAALISVPIWIILGYAMGYYLGDEIASILKGMKEIKLVVTLVIVTIITIVMVRSYFKYQKARKLGNQRKRGKASA